MTNNKLSLNNVNLKKSDLEERILAKLLKKDSTTNSNIEANAQDQIPKEKEHLTKTEKAARIQALINLKSLKKNADIIQPEPSKQINPISTNKEDVKYNDSEQANKEEQKHNKKEFVSRKSHFDQRNKKFSKYNKIILAEDTDTTLIKKKIKIQNRIGKKNLIRKIRIRSPMTVHEISVKTFQPKSKIIEEIKSINTSIDIEKPIDPDIIELVVQQLGHIPEVKLRHSINKLMDDNEDNFNSLKKRPPIVTIMGHVDHGKTTLIDALRDSNIVGKEYGGITQHMGAYQVGDSKDTLITIIDTPGHAAFTAMRARGAKVTDIAVLVIAADDSIKEQTIEAIHHIQAAKVPIIVAINKIDKPEANMQRVKNELLQYHITAEEFGGDVLMIPLSAKDKLNLDKLREAILLQADLIDIKANPDRKAKGVVLEARLDKRTGILATLMVENGTLRKGDVIVAGSAYCKIRAMINCHRKNIQEALPSTPVEILGFTSIPKSGEQFIATNNEKDARSIIELRSRDNKQIERSDNEADDLFQDEKQQIIFIIKADTQGSIEAIIDSVNKLKIDEIDVNLLHSAVGAITESDILLASASGASVIAFCIREDKKIADLAQKHGVTIRHYSIIYNLISDIKEIVSGFLPTIKEEKSIGTAIVREVFNISKIGKVAGCYVQDGLIKRDMNARLLRDSRIVYEGKIDTLRRFKKNEKEVKNGFECGISLENYSDIKMNDIIESFIVIEKKQLL